MCLAIPIITMYSSLKSYNMYEMFFWIYLGHVSCPKPKPAAGGAMNFPFPEVLDGEGKTHPIWIRSERELLVRN